ncbi:polyphosphate kinase [Caldovatus sediminis]|uniref:Polyphosphate kinase n=1 Tax=Caldovatus sediminis TaxID=2041189 RepID=A0A8J2ZEX1_9PROT|nr:VOC family protein [Caldovatus sediminis]GGG47231.1 polyphosphate kinase [Caldovatus sediminis]
MAEIDHIVIGARTLEEGAAWVEQQLGARPEKGGAHEGVGTHNMLLGMGPDCYLEVIAPDPSQPEPAHPRPFDLDEPAVRTRLDSGPALLAYVARTPALDAVVARLGPARSGEIRTMRRGDLAWRIAFPPQRQDLDNLIPPLIQWDGPRAGERLRDSGCRLLAIEAEHPDADALRAALASRGLEEAVTVRHSPHARLVVHIRRADGKDVTLTSG